jgi:hypothetical protein
MMTHRHCGLGLLEVRRQWGRRPAWLELDRDLRMGKPSGEQWRHDELTGENGGDWVARRRRSWRQGGGVGPAWSEQSRL